MEKIGLTFISILIVGCGIACIIGGIKILRDKEDTRPAFLYIAFGLCFALPILNIWLKIL